MKSFRQFCRDKSVAPMVHTESPCTPMVRETTETPTDPQDSAQRIVQMPLRELIDSLEVFAAHKSEVERWVEIVDFPEYGTFSVEFLAQRVEPDSASEPEQEEAEGSVSGIQRVCDDGDYCRIAFPSG